MNLRLHYRQDDGHKFTHDTTIYPDPGGGRRLNRLLWVGLRDPYYSWQPKCHIVRIERIEANA